jgi:hypothetical protein
MTTHSRPLDWKLYDFRVQELEKQLEALVSSPEYSGDDRRLARVYVGFGRLLADRLEPTLVGYLTLAEQYAATGIFPAELEGISQKLGSVSQQLAAAEAQSGIETDQPFIYKLLESCTVRKFTIYPITDVEPVAWMAAAGVSTDAIAQVVHSIYPELLKG